VRGVVAGVVQASAVPHRPPALPRARELCWESVEAQSDARKVETMFEGMVLCFGDGVAEETRTLMRGQRDDMRQCSAGGLVVSRKHWLADLYARFRWVPASRALRNGDFGSEASRLKSCAGRLLDGLVQRSPCPWSNYAMLHMCKSIKTIS